MLYTKRLSTLRISFSCTIAYRSYLDTVPRVGDHIRFRIYAGREVDGVIRAILKTTSGVKLRVEHGSGVYVATIEPDQILTSKT